MAPKYSSFLFVILSVLVLSAPHESSARRGIAVGGWRKIDDVKAAEVVKIGKFAVAEHNRGAKTSLRFVSVLEGETQVVSGMKYRLVVAATAGDGGPKNYSAVVWVQPWRNMKQLLSFEKTETRAVVN